MKHLLMMLSAAALFSVSAWAGLIGQSVTGTLRFSSNPNNYFNSVFGYVPTGCANSGLGSATVTIGATTEFCFDEANLNRDTADFSDTQLVVTDLVKITGSNSPLTMTFAFAPGVVTGVSEFSDSFNNGGMNFSFANNVLTLSWTGGNVAAGSLTAVYDLTTATSVPEPSMVVLLGIGLSGIAVMRSRRTRS